VGTATKEGEEEEQESVTSLAQVQMHYSRTRYHGAGRDGHITSALGERTAHNSRAQPSVSHAGRLRWMALAPGRCPSKGDRTRNY